MFKVTGFVFLLFVVNKSVISENITLDEGVLVLTKSNFQTAVRDNEFILVLFYNPWCGSCALFAPEYAKAAKSLADQRSKIKLGKVDAAEEQELIKQFEIRAYPTLKFFRKGSPIEYLENRHAYSIVNWLLKKSGPPAKDISSIDAAKEFINANNVAVIGFFKDQNTEAAKAFLDVAFSIVDIPFGITDDEPVFTEYDAKDDSIVLFRKFEEPKVVYVGIPDSGEIKKFVQSNALPLLVELNHDTAQKIFFGEIKSYLLLFLNKKDESYQKVSDAARSIAKPYRGKVLFVTIDVEDGHHQILDLVIILEFFGITKNEVPVARLIKLGEDMANYKPPTAELTADNLKQFVNDFLDGKMKQQLLSQDLPEDWDKKAVRELLRWASKIWVYDE